MRLVFPDSPILREVFAGDIEPGPSLHPYQVPKKTPRSPEEKVRGARTRARRRYIERLEKASADGRLPPRVFISARLWGFPEEELLAALQALKMESHHPTREEPAQLRRSRRRAGRKGRKK